MVFAACNTDNGIDTATLQALGESMTMDDMLDLLELKAVRDSWSHAELFNMDEKRERDELLRGGAGSPAGSPARRSRRRR